MKMFFKIIVFSLATLLSCKSLWAHDSLAVKSKSDSLRLTQKTTDPNQSKGLLPTVEAVIDSTLNQENILPYFVDEFYPEGIIGSALIPDDSIQYYMNKCHDAMDKVRKAQNYIKNLNDATSFNLPVGISKLVQGLNYDIAIDAIRLKPTHAEVDVYMEFEIPQNGKLLMFMARGIKFTRAGGIVGDARLELIGEMAINFNGDKSQIVLKGGQRSSNGIASSSLGGTYVKMDCDGFKEMGLDADIRFSRDLLVPEDAAGNIVAGNVVGSFKTVLTNWNDLIVQLNLPNFQIKGLNGFGFSLQQVVFDFSDKRNAPGVVFPQGYQQESDQSLANLWRGFYAHDLSIRLPQHFKSNQGARTTFSATDLIIDHQGVSGIFTGKNLIPLNNGDMNGWAFSLDSLAVSLVANQIKSAGFKGNIIVPVADEQSPFKYTASFSGNDQYFFSVASTKDMQFKLWNTSKVEIYKASRLEVTLKDGKFLPKAVLHGQMNITAKLSEKGQGANLADIKFENLELQSVKPYLKVGTFSFGSEAAQQKMAGFPISIKDIGLKQISDKETGLQFSLMLNLTGEGSGAFAADAGLILVGELNTGEGKQKWKYKDVQVESIKVDIHGGAFNLNGSLTFYRNDPAYGDGFNGVVKAEFVSSIKVSASAIFGNVNGMRYWYADAMAQFKPGIPIFPGVAFYGFGGGAYHHMKMATGNTGSNLGKTASGIVYVPDEKSGLGIKAILNIGSSPSDQAFNGDVTFEVSFFTGGGIRTISMTGNAFIATPKLDGQMEKLAASAKKMANAFSQLESQANSKTNDLASKIANQESSIKAIHGDIGKAAGGRGAISAHAFILYDFENRELHGNFSVGIDLAGGIMKGKGEAVLHFAPHEWYVYVGTPDQRVTLSVGIGPIRASAGTYFMVGSKIPASPSPPQNVQDAIKGIDLNYMKDLNTIAAGGGFAFGASFELSTGDITFLMFYANFSATAGFDIMVKNYGDTYCEGSSDRIGINGWYANGQAYAHFSGSVGIKVNVFFSKIKVEILSLTVGAVMQAKLPNPFWMRGAVGGSFSALGGLVSGHCSFQVTLGKECKLIQKQDDSALSNIAVISQMTPSIGETEINVFNNPQVVFNFAVEKEFALQGDNQAKQQYRVKLDYFNVTVDGNKIPGSLQWNNDRTVLVFSSIDILPPKKEIKTAVQVSFEKQSNGAWIKALQNGQSIVEKQEASFITGTAPDYIPASNVEYSYPIIGQLNYYKDETGAGYIKLIKGQPYLFQPGAEWKQTGRFREMGGAAIPFDFSYNSSALQINFTTPGANLKTGKIYTMELVNLPVGPSGAIDRNVSSSRKKVDVEGQNTGTEIKTQQASGSITQLQEKTIFTSNFRTSNFSTVKAKLANMNFSTGWTWNISTGVVELGSSSQANEVFDRFEMISGNYEQNKSILYEADVTNSWYKDKVSPLIYNDYPWYSDMAMKGRTSLPVGIPPIRSIYQRQYESDLALTPSAAESGSFTFSGGGSTIIYNLPKEMYRDYLEILSLAANKSLTTRDARLDRVLLTSFPALNPGDYKIKVKHQLPGTRTVTSENMITINYTIQFVR